MANSSTQKVVEAAYARLRKKLESKDVGGDKLRAAALAALKKAKQELEVDPDWVATEPPRRRKKPSSRKSNDR